MYSGVSKGNTFLEQHFMLVIIGSVIGGIIILVLIISAIISLRIKRKKNEDTIPLTPTKKTEDTIQLSRVEKQALSLILRANKD